MSRTRIGSTHWVAAPPAIRVLVRPRPPVVAIWIRTAAVMSAAATLGFPILSSTPRVDQVTVQPGPGTDAPQNASRLADLAATTGAHAAGDLLPASLFRGERSAASGSFEREPAIVPAQSFAPSRNRAGHDWREQDAGT